VSPICFTTSQARDVTVAFLCTPTITNGHDILFSEELGTGSHQEENASGQRKYKELMGLTKALLTSTMQPVPHMIGVDPISWTGGRLNY